MGKGDVPNRGIRVRSQSRRVLSVRLGQILLQADSLDGYGGALPVIGDHRVVPRGHLDLNRYEIVSREQEPPTSLFCLQLSSASFLLRLSSCLRWP